MPDDNATKTRWESLSWTAMPDDNAKTKTGWESFSWVVIFIVFLPISALLHAWAATVAWEWFMVPRFGTGPTLEQWFGIGLIFDLLGLAYVSRRDKGKALALQILNALVTPLVLLGGAYLVKVVCGW